MDLIADRFFIIDDHRAIDLATGENVVLMVSTPGGVTEQRAWTTRCDWLFRLRHRAIAPLIDYGVFGEMRRFEAWQCEGPWRGSLEQARATRDRASMFMRANELTDGAPALAPVHTLDGAPIAIPLATAAYPDDSVQSAAELDLHDCGNRIVERPSVTAIAEVFAEASRSHRTLSVCAPIGSGLRSIVRDLARAARIAGFVPMSLSVDTAAGVRTLLQRRSLFLIANRIESRQVWNRAIEWTLRSPKPHVLLGAEADAAPGVQTVRIERIDAGLLVESILPVKGSPAIGPRVWDAARRSRGLPVRFATLLWGDAREAHRPTRIALPIAAEKPRVYGDETAASESVAVISAPHWPAPGELAALRRKVERAQLLLSEGKHAPGERVLRSAIAGLVRRHDWEHATKGALVLAASLLRRGRPKDAQQILDDSGDYGRPDKHDQSKIDIGILAATAWTDLGRVDEAESVLTACLAAAESLADPARIASCRISLARSLFWRGRYDEAHRTLSPVAAAELNGELSIRHAIACSRVGIGRNDLESGVSRAARALESAEQIGAPSLVARAYCALAFAHLAIGDRSAVERDVAACVNASRTAREPLRALRARLIDAESERRTGRNRVAAALLRRIRRIQPGHLPMTVRARVALLTDLVSDPDRAGSAIGEVVRRHIAATGFGALALFAPRAIGRHEQHETTRDVVDLVRLCQSTDDDTVVLTRICALVRDRLRAAAVAVFISDRGVPVPVALDGSSRIEPEIARRAIAASQLIAPHVCQNYFEAAAPVRCGADTHGALVVRWPFGSSPDREQVAMLLTTAAAAAAPAMASIVARRGDGQIHAIGELIGASAAMESVRRSIERAAAAPFAVLVEGESGCGKELVARALHRRSPRRDRPFCTLNCAALPDDLVEAELFGHAKGAFTGAVAERPGVFEQAHTGTIFLDEIGELSMRAQAKVLRTIQDGELRRLGENVSRRVDVRIISATNRDLRQEVAAGRFRHDLVYRLDVVRIAIPPLRDRRDDIAALVHRFWTEAIERVGSRAALAAATVAALARYDWPGNVRELQNVLASLAVRGPRRGVVPPSALPPQFGRTELNPACRLEDARRTFEEHFVRAALVRTGGHRIRAAEELGVTRQGLTKLMSRLGISD